MKTTTVRLDDDLAAFLDAVIEHRGGSASDLIRTAIREHLAKLVADFPEIKEILRRFEQVHIAAALNSLHSSIGVAPVDSPAELLSTSVELGD